MTIFCQRWGKSSGARALPHALGSQEPQQPGHPVGEHQVSPIPWLCCGPQALLGMEKTGSPGLGRLNFYPPVKGGLACVKQREAQYFLSACDWTTTIFKCSRKSQNYPTSPPQKIFFLPGFCSEYFQTSRRVFSDIHFCLHCSGGCCGLGLRGPGLLVPPAPECLGVSLCHADPDTAVLSCSSNPWIPHVLEEARGWLRSWHGSSAQASLQSVVSRHSLWLPCLLRSRYVHTVLSNSSFRIRQSSELGSATYRLFP